MTSFNDYHKQVLIKFKLALQKEDQATLEEIKRRSIFKLLNLVRYSFFFISIILLLDKMLKKPLLGPITNHFNILFWSFIFIVIVLSLIIPSFNTEEVIDTDTIQENLIKNGFDFLNLEKDAYELRQAFGELIHENFTINYNSKDKQIKDLIHSHKLMKKTFEYGLISKEVVNYEIIEAYMKNNKKYYRYDFPTPFYMNANDYEKIKTLGRLLEYNKQAKTETEKILFYAEINKVYQNLHHPLERIYYEI